MKVRFHTPHLRLGAMKIKQLIAGKWRAVLNTNVSNTMSSIVSPHYYVAYFLMSQTSILLLRSFARNPAGLRSAISHSARIRPFADSRHTAPRRG